MCISADIKWGNKNLLKLGKGTERNLFELSYCALLIFNSKPFHPCKPSPLARSILMAMPRWADLTAIYPCMVERPLAKWLQRILKQK